MFARGGMGQILTAFDRQRGQLVRVKMIPEGAHGPEWPARYRHLMEILSRLTHPAFIPILEVESANGWLLIVTPVVEGRSLSDSLGSNGRMAPREAAALIAELAEALQQAHELGAVHTDHPNVERLTGCRRPTPVHRFRRGQPGLDR